METKVAVISILVEDNAKAAEVNALLHDYNECVVGRLGIPYRAKNVNIICVALDAPEAKVAELTAALGKLEGVSAKAVCSKG